MAKKKGVQYAVITGEGVKYQNRETNGVTKATVPNTRFDVVNIIEHAGLPIGVMDYTAYMLKDSYSAYTSCLPTEQYDEEKGKDIAKRKALVRYNADKLAMIDAALADIDKLIEKLQRQRRIASDRIDRDLQYLRDEVDGKHADK